MYYYQVITLCFINIYDVITYSITLQDFGILILNDGKKMSESTQVPIGNFFSPTSNPHPLLLMYQIGKFLQIGIRLQVVTLMARFKKASDSIGGNRGSKMQVAQRARLQKGGIQGNLTTYSYKKKVVLLCPKNPK